jgi:hypothetical protein
MKGWLIIFMNIKEKSSTKLCINIMSPNEMEASDSIEIFCEQVYPGKRQETLDMFLASTSSALDYTINNSYLEVKKYNEQKFAIYCRGEFYGLIGYVEQEYESDVESILQNCHAYRLDVCDYALVGPNAIMLKLSFK